MPGSEMVQSVLKALDMLRAATEAPGGMRLAELAAAGGLKKTTAHNLMRTLCARGFLVKEADGRFGPGVAVQELARLSRHQAVLDEAARWMRAFADGFPSAVVTFSELTPTGIVCRMRLSPDRPGEMQHPLDRLFAPYLTVTALCLQATGSHAAEFERHFPFDEHGAGRWRTLDAFLKAKVETRRRGWCLARRPGHLAIAFPVPENFAVGFSLDDPPDGFVEQVKARVAGFREALAGTTDGPSKTAPAPRRPRRPGPKERS